MQRVVWEEKIDERAEADDPRRSALRDRFVEQVKFSTPPAPVFDPEVFGVDASEGRNGVRLFHAGVENSEEGQNALRVLRSSPVAGAAVLETGVRPPEPLAEPSHAGCPSVVYDTQTPACKKTPDWSHWSYCQMLWIG